MVKSPGMLRKQTCTLYIVMGNMVCLGDVVLFVVFFCFVFFWGGGGGGLEVTL